MNTLLTNIKNIKGVKDTDQVIFNDEHVLIEFLNSVKQETEVRNVPLNMLCPKGAEYGLLLDMSSFKKARVGNNLDIPDIGDESVLSCLEDNEAQIFVTVPGANRWHWVPLRGCSYDSLLERAELSCKALKRTTDTSRWYSVSAEKRAETIDMFLQAAKPVGGKGISGPRTCQTIIINNKVNYFGSAAYSYTADIDAYDVIKKNLGKEFPKVDLEKGWWGYDISVLDLCLNDESKDDSLLSSLNADEEKYSSACYGVRMINSLNGKSALKALPFIKVDGVKITIDTGVRAKTIHMGGSSILERFQDSLKSLVEKAFEDIDDILERLGNVEIDDVSLVIQRMAENIPEMRGCSSTLKEGTAMDCLLEAVRDQPEELIVSRYLLYLDYKAIEEGTFEWSSLKK